MTITSSTTNRAGPYVGDASATSFPFLGIKVFDAADIVVVLRNTDDTQEILVKDVDYTVTLNADQNTAPGGSITYPVTGDPLAATEYLTILNQVDEIQSSDILNLSGFFPQIIENMADRSVMMAQQNRESLNRTIRFALGANAAQIASTMIPVSTTDRYLKLGSTGLLEFAVSTDGSVVIDRSTLGALLWPIVGSEGATVVDIGFPYGHTHRYGAVLDGGGDNTDNTSFFQNAIDSGFPAWCDMPGNVNIVGTVEIAAGQSFTGNAHLRCERYTGSATTPVFHLWGTEPALFGNNMQIRNAINDHPAGVVLVGQDPLDGFGDRTDVPCYRPLVKDVDVGGSIQVKSQLGHPVFYIHSARRKMYGTVIGDRKPTYYGEFTNLDLINGDTLLELSSDANMHHIDGIQLHQWKKAAIFCNAVADNNVEGVKMESVFTVSPTRRYALHLGAQNEGIESDTAAGYSVDAAQRNKFEISGELPGAGSNIVSLFRYTEAGTSFGNNDIEYNGSLGAGSGIDGLTDDAGIGTNNYVGPGADVTRGRPVVVFDHATHKLTDGSGTVDIKGDSSAEFSSREAQIVDGAAATLFVIDNIGPNTAAVHIEVTYAAKADADNRASVGKYTFGVMLRNGTPQASVELTKDDTPFGGTDPITSLTCVAAASGSNAKATIAVQTADLTGVNSHFIGWHCRVVSTQLHTGATPNWDPQGDINISP